MAGGGRGGGAGRGGGVRLPVQGGADLAVRTSAGFQQPLTGPSMRRRPHVHANDGSVCEQDQGIHGRTTAASWTRPPPPRGEGASLIRRDISCNEI